MDERFAEADAEDLARCDGICIICREEMAAGAGSKKVPGGLVFPMRCVGWGGGVVGGLLAAQVFNDCIQVSRHICLVVT